MWFWLGQSDQFKGQVRMSKCETAESQPKLEDDTGMNLAAAHNIFRIKMKIITVVILLVLHLANCFAQSGMSFFYNQAEKWMTVLIMLFVVANSIIYCVCVGGDML